MDLGVLKDLTVCRGQEGGVVCERGMGIFSWRVWEMSDSDGFRVSKPLPHTTVYTRSPSAASRAIVLYACKLYTSTNVYQNSRNVCEYVRDANVFWCPENSKEEKWSTARVTTAGIGNRKKEWTWNVETILQKNGYGEEAEVVYSAWWRHGRVGTCELENVYYILFLGWV